MRALIKFYRTRRFRPHSNRAAGQHSQLCYIISAFYPLECADDNRPPMPGR